MPTATPKIAKIVGSFRILSSLPTPRIRLGKRRVRAPRRPKWNTGNEGVSFQQTGPEETVFLRIRRFCRHFCQFPRPQRSSLKPDYHEPGFLNFRLKRSARREAPHLGGNPLPHQTHNSVRLQIPLAEEPISIGNYGRYEESVRIFWATAISARGVFPCRGDSHISGDSNLAG
jgi:hypothetical protein